jgi:hypothetical protein
MAKSDDTQMTKPFALDIRHIIERPFTDASVVRMHIQVERGHPSEMHELYPDGSLGFGLGYRLETDDEIKLRMHEVLNGNS